MAGLKFWLTEIAGNLTENEILEIIKNYRFFRVLDKSIKIFNHNQDPEKLHKKHRSDTVFFFVKEKCLKDYIHILKNPEILTDRRGEIIQSLKQ